MIIVFLYFNPYYYYYHFAYHHYDNQYFCFRFYHFVECSKITFENSWYLFSVRREYLRLNEVYGGSWLSNRGTCQSQGGDLVSIETEEEWKFINDVIQRRDTKIQNEKDYENIWEIGLTKKAGNWTWVNGRPLTICKWGEGEPSGEHNAAVMYRRSRNGERGVFGSVIGITQKKRPAYICDISRGKLFVLFCFRLLLLLLLLFLLLLLRF